MFENDIKEIIEAQDGNSEVLAKLVEKNTGLIWSIVRRFKDRGYELEDLYQIGSIGFIKAIKRFDTAFDVKLSTYAVPYILGEIKRFIRDDGSVKVSRSVKELAAKIRDIQARYLREKGEEISISEMAKELKISKEEIAVALDSLNPTVSIYEQIYSDEEGGIHLVDKLDTGIDEAETIVDNISLKNAISTLGERERQLIILRYFRNKTQMQVAKILGVSQVQVSRMEKRILEQMKTKLAM